MRRGFSDYLIALRGRLLGAQARLPIAVRTDILEGRIVDDPLNAFVVRVRANATSVTPDHIDELKRHGLDEDQIFEAAVCAAVRAGLERYEAAKRAMNDAT